MRSGRQRRKAVFGAALAIVSLSGCGLLDNGDDSAAADDAVPIATAPPVEVQTAASAADAAVAPPIVVDPAAPPVLADPAAEDAALVGACVQYVPVAAFSGSPSAQVLWNLVAQDPNALTMKCTEWL